MPKIRKGEKRRKGTVAVVSPLFIYLIHTYAHSRSNSLEKYSCMTQIRTT